MDKFLKIAKKFISEQNIKDLEIVTNGITNTDEFFIFSYNSKKFLETNDDRYMLIGQGPIFIIKKDYRIVEYGSYYSKLRAQIDLTKKLNKERLIRIFCKDYDLLGGNYDLIIYSVFGDEQLDKLISILIENRIRYQTKKLSDNKKDYQSEYYTKDKLKKKLKKLPVNLGSDFCYNLFEDVMLHLINENITYLCEFRIERKI